MWEDKANRAQLIADLAASQNEPSIRHLVKVLDVLTDELRRDNDTANDREVHLNQGAIRGYQLLKVYIQRGLPTN